MHSVVHLSDVETTLRNETCVLFSDRDHEQSTVVVVCYECKVVWAMLIVPHFHVGTTLGALIEVLRPNTLSADVLLQAAVPLSDECIRSAGMCRERVPKWGNLVNDFFHSLISKFMACITAITTCNYACGRGDCFTNTISI